ncbi:ATP-binding protein [Mediterraneibacter agrestimuris]|uniref:ATP-binding protein n=1 Tax=Mediterraneibacter agrestimuris TaxID=2941333 RepID=UPI00203D99B1|nr:sensor histidine kinase [Mediterraneibacter agrestimuris]
MEMSLYQVMFILGTAGRTYIVYRFLRLFYQKKPEKKLCLDIGLYGCYFVLTVFAAFVNNPSPLMSGESIGYYYTTDIHKTGTLTILMCITELAAVLGMTFYYERNIRKNILVTMGASVLFRAADIAAFYFVKMTDGMRLMHIEAAAVFQLMLSAILVYMVVFTGVGIKNIQNGVKKPVIYRILVFLVPCGIGYLLFRLVFLIFYQIQYYLDKKTSPILFAVIIGLFWLYDFTVWSISDTYEKMLLQRENRYYESQLKNMEQSTAAWKQIQHDLNNHFIVLRGMLDFRREDEAKKYLDNLIRYELGSRCEVQSGNTAIDSILNYKKLEAEQHSVTFEPDVQIPKELDISSHAMSIILGNAIDNAIEAAEKTEEKSICLILHYTKGRLLIQISNPYIGELQTGAGGEYLTGKKEKVNHGFGLKNIRETVEKVGGVMDIDTKGHRFTLTVLLYV